MQNLKIVYFLFLSLSAHINVFAQTDSVNNFPKKPSKWYFSMACGYDQNLIYNNEFSKEMESFFSDNGDVAFGRYLGKKRDNGLAFTISGYVHYNQPSNKMLVNFLNEYGDFKYGDIVFNNWAEWRFGLGYYHFFNLKERWLLSGILRPDILLGSRSQSIYYTSDNQYFIYAHVPEMKCGWTITGDVGIHYRIRYALGYTSTLGISYDMIYGSYPAIYQVRYGQGDDPYTNFDYYEYSETFKILRARLKLVLTIDIRDVQ